MTEMNGAIDGLGGIWKEPVALSNLSGIRIWPYHSALVGRSLIIHPDTDNHLVPEANMVAIIPRAYKVSDRLKKILVPWEELQDQEFLAANYYYETTIIFTSDTEHSDEFPSVIHDDGDFVTVSMLEKNIQSWCVNFGVLGPRRTKRLAIGDGCVTLTFPYFGGEGRI